MDQDITEGLSDLAQRLSRVKELLEWQRLIEQEQPRQIGGVMGFKLHDSEQHEIAIAYGSFVSLALDLQEVIDFVSSDSPLKDCRRWQRQLHGLVEECQRLSIPDRFINR